MLSGNIFCSLCLVYLLLSIYIFTVKFKLAWKEKGFMWATRKTPCLFFLISDRLEHNMPFSNEIILFYVNLDALHLSKISFKLTSCLGGRALVLSGRF